MMQQGNIGAKTMANQAMQSIIQSKAREFASLISVDGQVTALITQEVEDKVASRLRPVYMWQALMDEMQDELDNGPLVDSGPEGTNNPDRYVKKVTKQGVEKYGSFWQDFATDLGVCEKWTTYLGQLELASKPDCPADLTELKNKGPKWLEAEKRNVNERIRTAKELVVTAVRVHQMIQRLEEHDTIEITLDTVKDGQGEDVLNGNTQRPFIARERYAKRDKEGKVVKVDDEIMYTYTDKVRYLSVGELIGLAPEEAATMSGGFSFDNLFKAAAHKRERERSEQGKKVSVNNAELFITYISQTTDYITGEGYEKKLARLVETARKDETVLDAIMQHAMAFDALYEELKPDWERMRQSKRDAKNGAHKAA
jgi:hypothetical protein